MVQKLSSTTVKIITNIANKRIIVLKLFKHLFKIYYSLIIFVTTFIPNPFQQFVSIFIKDYLKRNHTKLFKIVM